jgi:hypothetical protein
MDVLAHGLWTNIMYKVIPQTRSNKKITLWGIVFGILPDFLSFGPVIAYTIFAWIFLSQPFLSEPPGPDLPFYGFAEVMYNYTHSLVVWIAVSAIVWAILKKFPWIFLGWVLHILIDIFSHTDAYFATPFLFPLSDFKVSIISWAHPVFILINYGLLLILYFFVIPKLTKQTSPQSQA